MIIDEVMHLRERINGRRFSSVEEMLKELEEFLTITEVDFYNQELWADFINDYTVKIGWREGDAVTTSVKVVRREYYVN